MYYSSNGYIVFHYYQWFPSIILRTLSSADIIVLLEIILLEIITFDQINAMEPMPILVVGILGLTTNTYNLYLFKRLNKLSNQIKNYLFTRINKFIVYIRAKCSNVFTYIQTQLL